jgi:argininosuccinate synthase
MKIVLAYSGGLEPSIISSLAQRKLSAEVIAFYADSGQDEEL